MRRGFARARLPVFRPADRAGRLAGEPTDSLANYVWTRKLDTADGYPGTGPGRVLGVSLLRDMAVGKLRGWAKMAPDSLYLQSPFRLGSVRFPVRVLPYEIPLGRFLHVDLKDETQVMEKRIIHYSALNEGEPFRIAILGDGFTTEEQLDLTALAKAFTLRLLTVSPFKENAAHLEIWLLPTASLETGISYCDAAGEVDTSFDVRACYTPNHPQECQPGDPDTPPEWFLGTDDIGRELIRSTAQEVLQPSQRFQCHLVIANCDTDGGRADAAVDWRIAFAGRPVTDREGAVLDAAGQIRHFTDNAIHECAHVIAGLGDEYLFCDPWPGTSHPNMATLDQVDDGAMPWAAAAAELEVELKSPHRLGSLVCDNKHNANSISDASEYGPGAYWGCGYWAAQYAGEINRSSHGCDAWADPWGSDFFRCEGMCRMRAQGAQFFCLACRAALENAILNPAEDLP
ncbi:MAG: M64 family metallopeptidase [Candidatus Eisenbacteria bacterium]